MKTSDSSPSGWKAESIIYRTVEDVQMGFTFEIIELLPYPPLLAIKHCIVFLDQFRIENIPEIAKCYPDPDPIFPFSLGFHAFGSSALIYWIATLFQLRMDGFNIRKHRCRFLS